ncbi:hypothetical protein NLJ89_g10105 [Agrocybe chaxingu]|uniref:HMG box domain-containing protein n=1 Tax=Agrocybe chaxingu TaxID=84603 RepID=A0A9W8MQL0_9AGAR|nr:hypothetical protein NLJ89_g10105 [Agrocybe chaxingu]
MYISATTTPSVRSLGAAFTLPHPTNTRPDPNKKSHARKQPPGHVPRPRNAFILFRCDFVRQKKIPESVENDHRNISRIVGKIWREMSDEDKEPWVAMADEEKRRHLRTHPGYRFTPGNTVKKKPKRGDDTPHEMQYDEIVSDEALFLALARASSCPPGALHIPQANIEFLNGYGQPLKTRDDLARRPSRIIFYQSTPQDFRTDQAAGSKFFTDMENQHVVAETAKERHSVPPAHEDFVHPSPDGSFRKEDYSSDSDIEGMFCGPRIASIAHLPAPHEPPQWQTIHRDPIPWTDWCDINLTNPFNQDYDTDSSYSQDSPPPPVFYNPFPSTLPPLPPMGLGFSADHQEPLASVVDERKYSDPSLAYAPTASENALHQSFLLSPESPTFDVGHYQKQSFSHPAETQTVSTQPSPQAHGRVHGEPPGFVANMFMVPEDVVAGDGYGHDPPTPAYPS